MRMKINSISKAEHLTSFWYKGPGELEKSLRATRVMHLICPPPPQFCISIVFNSSWDSYNTQEKWITKVMQSFWGGEGGRWCALGEMRKWLIPPLLIAYFWRLEIWMMASALDHFIVLLFSDHARARCCVQNWLSAKWRLQENWWHLQSNWGS